MSILDNEGLKKGLQIELERMLQPGYFSSNTPMIEELNCAAMHSLALAVCYLTEKIEELFTTEDENGKESSALDVITTALYTDDGERSLNAIANKLDYIEERLEKIENEISKI